MLANDNNQLLAVVARMGDLKQTLNYLRQWNEGLRIHDHNIIVQSRCQFYGFQICIKLLFSWPS